MAKDTTAPTAEDQYTQQLLADLEQAKRDAEQARKDAEAARKDAAEAKALLADAAPTQVVGAYKGYKFAPGQTRVRDAEGRIADAQQVMDAANAGDAEACAILDRLIDMNYALLVPEA